MVSVLHTIDHIDALELKKQSARALCARSFEYFVQTMWSVVDPRPLKWNWHLGIMCRELEMVFRGETKRLVISVPPGTAKSLLVSVFWPAWVWLHRPQEQTLHVTNHPSLAYRDSKRMSRVVDSAAYRALVKFQCERMGVGWVIDKKSGETRPWRVGGGTNSVEKWENECQGFRECVSIGSTVTGKRADGLVIDDPIDAKDVIAGSVAQIAARIIGVNETYENVLKSRVNDANNAYIILIMQRLHVNDLAGHMISKGARHVVLPMLSFEPDDPMRHPDDPRPQGGQSIQEDRFSSDTIAQLRQDMVHRHWLAQYQQQPTDADGQLYRRDWLKFHKLDGQRHEFDEVAITVDCTFKDAQTSDFVVMQVWGRIGAKMYMLDQVRDRMSYVQTRAALVLLRNKWPRTGLVLVEDKANGSALIAEFQDVIPGILGYNPKSASKYARAELATVSWEAGQVYLPDPAIAPWIHTFIEELIKFPGAANDDQVDAMAQLFLHWLDKTKIVAIDPLIQWGDFLDF